MPGCVVQGCIGRPAWQCYPECRPSAEAFRLLRDVPLCHVPVSPSIRLNPRCFRCRCRCSLRGVRLPDGGGCGCCACCHLRGVPRRLYCPLRRCCLRCCRCHCCGSCLIAVPVAAVTAVAALPLFRFSLLRPSPLRFSPLRERSLRRWRRSGALLLGLLPRLSLAALLSCFLGRLSVLPLLSVLFAPVAAALVAPFGRVETGDAVSSER